MERTIYGHSKYVSMNETEASAAWAAILPGHGIVAIDRQYKEKNHLQQTLMHPNGSGYYVYGVEAYHAMHCIVCSKVFGMITVVS